MRGSLWSSYAKGTVTRLAKTLTNIRYAPDNQPVTVYMLDTDKLKNLNKTELDDARNGIDKLLTKNIDGQHLAKVRKILNVILNDDSGDDYFFVNYSGDSNASIRKLVENKTLVEFKDKFDNILGKDLVDCLSYKSKYIINTSKKLYAKFEKNKQESGRKYNKTGRTKGIDNRINITDYNTGKIIKGTYRDNPSRIVDKNNEKINLSLVDLTNRLNRISFDYTKDTNE